jgi:hypothetical protein
MRDLRLQPGLTGLEHADASPPLKDASLSSTQLHPRSLAGPAKAAQYFQASANWQVIGRTRRSECCLCLFHWKRPTHRCVCQSSSVAFARLPAWTGFGSFFQGVANWQSPGNGGQLGQQDHPSTAPNATGQNLRLSGNSCQNGQHRPLRVSCGKLAVMPPHFPEARRPKNETPYCDRTRQESPRLMSRSTSQTSPPRWMSVGNTSQCCASSASSSKS